MFIETVDDFDKLPKRTPIEFFCKKCGKEVHKKVGASKQRILQRRLLCRNCSTKETCQSRYGVDNVSQLRETQSKIKATSLQRYGVEHYNKSKTAAVFHRKTYLFDNLYFDSSWELIFYIWHKIQGHNIKKCEQSFKYIYENKEYSYFPDFKIDNQLYEIKGDQFWKGDGTMCNPYDHNKDGLFEAKHQCGLLNGVVFISKSDIIPMKDFVVQQLGKDFIKNCRTVRQSPRKTNYTPHPKPKRVYLDVRITTPEEFDNLKRGDTFRYNCIKCGLECAFKKKDRTRWTNQRRLLCINCQKKDTLSRREQTKN